jgi:hypothetical protein
VHRTLLGLEYENDGLIELAPNQWFDPHASSLKLDTFEVCADTRAKIVAAMATIREATTVFMTLGLTETWVDRETGLVLNVPPAPLYIKKYGDRFAFFNATYPDTLEALESTIALIRDKCRADMKFIVTVSPVSLFSTYTQMDVVTANTYSKSVLRAVAQTVANKHAFVDYYPSFEMIMNSPRMTTWERDQHHVDAKAVDGVVSRAWASIFSETSKPCTCAAPCSRAKRQNQPKPQPRSSTARPASAGSSARSAGHSGAPSRPSMERGRRLYPAKKVSSS